MGLATDSLGLCSTYLYLYVGSHIQFHEYTIRVDGVHKGISGSSTAYATAFSSYHT